MSNTLQYTPPPSLKPFLVSDKFVNLAVGPVGCLAGSTLIVTEEGPIPIADIDRPMRVLSWNAETCRYQLSQSSVAFPKGTDYLYRVVTPQGEFDAAGSHLLLCADGKYRRVEALRRGDVLKTCSHNPLQTTAELSQSASLSGAPRSKQTTADCQGGYGVSDRLHGLLSRCVEAGALVFSPAHSGAQTYNSRAVLDVASPLDAQQAALLKRTRRELFAYRQQTDGFSRPVSRLRSNAACRASEESSEYAEGSSPVRRLFRRTKCFLLQVLGRGQSVRSLVRAWWAPSKSTSYRPIISVTRKQVKEIYWDLQICGTHNYVTVDGAVHHNSTKTTASLVKIAYEAKRIAPARDGIRRSRAIWIRQSREQLRDTSIPDFLRWYPDGVAGVYLKSEYKFILRFDDVEVEVLFRGLDDAADVRRLLSLQATFGIADEFRELNMDVFNALQARLGRYPSKADNGVGCYDEQGNYIAKFWGVTNPPDFSSPWEQYLSEPPNNAFVLIQPSALSQEADWLEYLPTGYYDNLIEGKTEDWISVYVHAQFGKSLSGQPVFRAFNRDFHVAKSPLLISNDANTPLLIGFDCGLTPAATLGKVFYDGRLLIHHNLTSEGMGALRFVREKLKPVIANRFAGHSSVVIIDPAGFQRAQTDERTVADILKNEGFKVIPARTNSITARLSAVDSYLTRTVDTKAGIQFDPEHCPELVRAMAGKYRYKIKASGEVDDKPEKSHPFSDAVDSLQYLCLHADNGALQGRSIPAVQPVKKAPYKWAV